MKSFRSLMVSAALILAAALAWPVAADAKTTTNLAPKSKVIAADSIATPAPDRADVTALEDKPDPSEPNEYINVIKNRAQKDFWAARKPPASPPAPAAEPQQIAAVPGNTLRRVSYSDATGVTFFDQPLRLGDSEAFRKSLDTVGSELGRPCLANEPREYLGWPLQQSEQKRVDHIFEETNEKLKLRGFQLLPKKPKAVGEDVSVMTLDRPDKHVLGIWSAGDTGLLLMLCDTGAPGKAVKAARAEKAKAQKKGKKAKAKRGKKKPLNQPVNTSIPGSAMPGGAPDNAISSAPPPSSPTALSETTPAAATGTPAAAPASAAPAAPSAKPEVIPGAPPRNSALPPAFDAEKPAVAAPVEEKQPQVILPPAIAPAVPPVPVDVKPAETQPAATSTQETKPVETQPAAAAQPVTQPPGTTLPATAPANAKPAVQGGTPLYKAAPALIQSGAVKQEDSSAADEKTNQKNPDGGPTDPMAPPPAQ